MKTRVRKARCKHVLVILNNRLETVELLREEVHPQTGGDFEMGPFAVAVVRFIDVEVSVPLQSVVFLKNRRDLRLNKGKRR